MIKKAVLLALKEGVLETRMLYGLDDDGFYAKLRRSTSRPSPLPRRSSRGEHTLPCST